MDKPQRPGARVVRSKSKPQLDFTLGPLTISLIHGDLLTIPCDALVCPIDKDLTVDQGIPDLIRSKEGDAIFAPVQPIKEEGKLRPGSSYAVESRRLAARQVYFAVVSDLYGGSVEPHVISKTLESVLWQAQRANVGSLALPPLGHPALKPPYSLLAEEILACLFNFAKNCSYDHGLRSVSIVLFNHDAFSAFSETAHALFSEYSTGLRLERAEVMLVPSLPKDSTVMMLGTEDSELEKVILWASDMPGVRLVCSSNIAKAVEFAKGAKPMVVMIDQAMLRGQSIAETLKLFREQVDANIGTVMIADNYLFEAAVDGVNSGIDAYLPRPFTGPQLQEAIRNAAAQRARRDTRDKRLKELETLNAAQELFLQTVCHDLKSPLSVLQSGFGMLARSLDPKDADMAQLSRLMAASTSHMEKLVLDLTDLAAMHAGKLKLRPVETEMTGLLKEVYAEALLLARERGIEMTDQIAADLPKMKVDPRRIQQVLMNLLTNSMKHTYRGSITVRAAVEEGSLLISVKDTGEGIEPQELSRIFEPMYQSKSSEINGREGMGLGLAIARGLVARHGGTIEAASEGLGKGLEVLIRLPLQ